MTPRVPTGPTALAVALLFFALADHALAQASVPPRDTLTLGALQAAAVNHDPRARQLDLLAAQSALREKSLDAERLPELGLMAQGSINQMCLRSRSPSQAA